MPEPAIANVFLTAVLFAGSMIGVNGQPTFQRACSCERSSADGKCRFLLEAEATIPNKEGGVTGGGVAEVLRSVNDRLTTLDSKCASLSERVSIVEASALKKLLTGLYSGGVANGGEEKGREGDRAEGVPGSGGGEAGTSNSTEPWRKQLDRIASRQQQMEQRIKALESRPSLCRYSVYYNVYSVQCTVYSVQCTVYSV